MQWKEKYDSDIENKTANNNFKEFIPFLENFVKTNNISIVAEEAGEGIILNDLLKRKGVAHTILQDIARRFNLRYFQFDMPKEELKSYVKQPVETEIRLYRNRLAAEDKLKEWETKRENSFAVAIKRMVKQEDSALLLMGSVHMEPVKKSLCNSDYKVTCHDTTQEKWYKQPNKEFWKEWFNE